MKQLRVYSLLLLLIILPINAVMAKLSVNWVRTGVVLESDTEGEFGSTLDITVGLPGATLEPVSSLRVDNKRVLLQFAWKPNKRYQIRLGKTIVDAASPLKPVPYAVRTIELDSLLSLMENLRQPARPITVATALTFGQGTDTYKLAVATDKGHLAIFDAISGKVDWKTRISEGYVRHIAF